jgi:uncharacterized repeat protein (TIGR02543 family)
MKMSKAVNGIICCGLLAVTAFVFTGCESYSPYNDIKNPVVETECFYVQLYKENGYAVVLELTDVGKERETLAVPDYVEGLPVKQVGMDQKNWQGPWGLASERIKKVYIPWAASVSNYAFNGCPRLEEIVFISTYGFWHITGHKIITTEKLYELYHQESIANSTILLAANLIYYYNHEESPNDDHYWIDYITGDNLYLNPPPPTREHYVFSGWYLEPECITAWDNTLPKTYDENLSLYADWQIDE